ncbi:MAG: ABC transporter permease [Paracoccaceae bacterium]
MASTWRRWLLILPPYVWMLAFFLVPFLIVFRISLSDSVVAMPPYAPVLDANGGWEGVKAFFAGLDWENYAWQLGDDLYLLAYLSSLKIALISTVLTLLIAYPIAYGMACARAEWRPLLVLMVIMPFWTSFLIRIYAWIGILSDTGLLNQFLLWIGLIQEPLVIMNTPTAVYIGIVYAYLPFMILPIYAALEKMDGSLLDAATDLGCTRMSAFWLVTLPMSARGVIAGCFLVFVPTVGEFVIPSLLGGSDTLMIGRVLWDEFFANRDWPLASAVAVILLALLVAPIIAFQRLQENAR